MATAHPPHKKPLYDWGLDPVHWAHAKLFIFDVLRLEPLSGIPGAYKLYERVILRVCVMGYVVSVDEKEKMLLFSVDDGTGVIMCCLWKNDRPGKDAVKLELGMLVTVRGKLKEFNDERQLTVQFLRREHNPNAEMLHWMEVMKLDNLCYNKKN